jgi:predicted RNase H-like HicB family nuclease
MMKWMTATYTARYTRIDSGYMGQLIEWPDVISEGSTLEECRVMLDDSLREMILAYRQQGKPVPVEQALLESLPAEI